MDIVVAPLVGLDQGSRPLCWSEEPSPMSWYRQLVPDRVRHVDALSRRSTLMGMTRGVLVSVTDTTRGVWGHRSTKLLGVARVVLISFTDTTRGGGAWLTTTEFLGRAPKQSIYGEIHPGFGVAAGLL